jgi:hypothetical protein
MEGAQEMMNNVLSEWHEGYWVSGQLKGELLSHPCHFSFHEWMT